MGNRIQILDAEQATLKLDRIAYEIVERNLQESHLILAGIVDRGASIARLLQQKIEAISRIKVSLFHIEVSKESPLDARLLEEGLPADEVILMVDDVANSGSTLLYASRLLLSFRPRLLQVAVLIDRQHKRFPVSPDYTGLCLSTTLQDHIEVVITEGRVQGAYLD